MTQEAAPGAAQTRRRRISSGHRFSHAARTAKKIPSALPKAVAQRKRSDKPFCLTLPQSRSGYASTRACGGKGTASSLCASLPLVAPRGSLAGGTVETVP
jgi:hypothetical protein